MSPPEAQTYGIIDKVLASPPKTRADDEGSVESKIGING